MGIVVILLLIVSGWALYHYWSRGRLDFLRSSDRDPYLSPEEILKRRMAEGVIDEKEYERIRRTIRS